MKRMKRKVVHKATNVYAGLWNSRIQCGLYTLTKTRISEKWTNVTCKNCLRARKK